MSPAELGVPCGEGLERRPSVVLPQLQELEKRFFELVGGGNVTEVREFLDSHPNFKVNVVNFQGVSALHLAVQKRDVAMVEFLLSHPHIDVGDTALHAIRENEPKIVLMLLDRLEEMTPGLEFAGVTHSPEFPDETTPLAVAAQHGHYELISLLQERGHSIRKPHPPSCYCEKVCKPQRACEDPLTLDKMRLSLYKAVANPAYICLTAEDPILVAFQISIELRNAAAYEREFYNAYKTLSDDVAQFATDLIGCTRTAEEVELILKQSAGLGFPTKFVYPRLLLAMDYRQKTFIAHPHVQQVMDTKWQGDWYEWKIKSIYMKVFAVLLRMAMLPVIAIIILMVPKSPKSKHWSIPVNKFISSLASYFIFLAFVFVESNIDKSKELRGPPESVSTTNVADTTVSDHELGCGLYSLNGLELVLVVYVIAYIWAAFRLCLIYGPRRFFRAPWNWYEVTMLSLFMLTFLFWSAAMVDVKRNGQRELERKYWHHYDPTLIAEGLFCMATIMAFFKLMFICQLDYNLGPLQMSLGKMINDVAKFIVVFTIIIFSFTAGLARLYQYYDGMVQIDDDTKMKTQQVSSFVDFTSTLKTLFWAIFCMTDVASADVVIENLPGETETETIINKHNFTETVGYVAFAGFEFISVIVVLNMLIACMSNTFTKVTDNVDVEWTFGRTEVYIDFMAQTSLPPPFNLFPTLGGIQAIGEFIKVLIKPPKNKKARWNLKDCCYVEILEDENKKDFPVVMSQLVQRYFRKKDTKTEETDIEGLRKELIELRSLLRDALAPVAC